MISVLYANFISEIHYLACLKIILNFIVPPISSNLYTLTVPFFDPTITYFPSGDTLTALPLAASEKSFVLLSLSRGILSGPTFKLAQQINLRDDKLQHLTVASSEQVNM